MSRQEQWTLLFGLLAVAGTALHSLVLASATSAGPAAAWPAESLPARAVDATTDLGETERWPVRATARQAKDPAASGKTPEAAAALPPPAAPRTEREHYEHFLALAGNGALDAVAAAVLHGSGPDCEKVACLRALHDAGSAVRREQFLFALAELHDESVRGKVSVADFALRFLADAARDDDEAWDTLRDAVWSRDRAMRPELRRRAVGALSAAADATQLRRLSLDLLTEADDGVVESALPNTHPSLGERRFDPTDRE